MCLVTRPVLTYYSHTQTHTHRVQQITILKFLPKESLGEKVKKKQLPKGKKKVLTQGVFEHLENETLHDGHVCRADTQTVVHWRKLHRYVHTHTHTHTHTHI